MGKTPYAGVARTLRNFEIPDSLFYEFEYIAEERSRTNTGEMVEAMRYVVDEYKKSNPNKIKKDGTLPKAKSRMQKMKK